MTIVIQKIIKRRLTEAIKTSGLSMTEIAAALGLSVSIIAQYCNTKKFPRLDTFAQLCKVLDVSADYILGLDIQ
ncbi:MAG: helix-turn-helix domain-containing protein [Clostridiaceae bacterium]|jgi:transcriptional regulator with XRE-family HTH domain|nr:helix-turn-helix domain-containing protein [Clostridiaceae bacterium]